MTGNTFTSSAPWRVAGKTVSTAQFAWTGYVFTLLLYAWVFSQWQAQPVPVSVYVLGVFVAAMCLMPLSLWTARGSRETPAFELVCIAYLLAFSMPLYLQKNAILIFSEYLPFTWDETYQTMMLTSVGIFMLIAGYYVVAESKVTFRSLQVDLPMHPQKRLVFIRGAFLAGLTLLLLRGIGLDLSVGSFNSLVVIIQNLVYVSIIMLGYRVLRGQESKGWALILYGATALSALFGLMTGMLENAIIPLLLLVIVRWNVLRRAPIGLLAIGLLAFVVLNSVKMSYRSQTSSTSASMGAGERLGLWMDLLEGSSKGTQNSFEDTFRHSMSRFDLLHSFVRVHQLTPASVPFYDGKTYGYLIYGWIPRFLWPDKPSAQEANVMFAVDYGFLPKEQLATTMTGIGHLPEAYANFGVWGMALIMALQGMFLAAAGKMLNGARSEGGKAIFLSVMIFFFNGIGSTTASLFMSIPLTVITMGIILRFFALGWRAAPDHHLSS